MPWCQDATMACMFFVHLAMQNRCPEVRKPPLATYERVCRERTRRVTGMLIQAGRPIIIEEADLIAIKFCLGSLPPSCPPPPGDEQLDTSYVAILHDDGSCTYHTGDCLHERMGAVRPGHRTDLEAYTAPYKSSVWYSTDVWQPCD